MMTTGISKFNRGWRDAQRRATVATRRDQFRYLPHLIAVLLAWGWMMDRQYAEEQVAAARMQATSATQTLLDCLNGRARWIAEDKKSMVACDVWSTRI